MVKEETKDKFQKLASAIDKATIEEKEKHAGNKTTLPKVSKKHFETEL